MTPDIRASHWITTRGSIRVISGAYTINGSYYPTLTIKRGWTSHVPSDFKMNILSTKPPISCFQCLNRHYFTFKYLLTTLQTARLSIGLVWFGFMGCNATFNNISVISWRFCPLENLTTSTYVECTLNILMLRLTRNHQIWRVNNSKISWESEVEWRKFSFWNLAIQESLIHFVVVRVVLDIITVIENIHASSKYHPKWAPVVERI